MLSSLFTITQQGCRTRGSCNVIKAATTQIQSTNNISRSSRHMSATAKVWIDKNTRVICQGFTGKQVLHYCAICIDTGTYMYYSKKAEVYFAIYLCSILSKIF
jgi:hypothetical protein